MTPGIDRHRLALHAARVDGVFDGPIDEVLYTRWRDREAAERLLADDRDAIIPAAITAAALRIRTEPDDIARTYFLDAEGVADEIVGRKLKVAPEDAVLMVLLAGDPRCWYYEIRVALHLAERSLHHHPGHPDVIAALTSLRDRLAADRLHATGFFAEKVRPWLSRLLAEQAPGGLVDLSFIDQRCAWGRAAALAVSHASEHHEWAGAFALHLAAPRGTRASAKWWDITGQRMHETWAQELVAELTGYLGTVDLTPADTTVDGHDAPDEHLVVPNNVPLARGVVWAESFATDAGAPERLGAAVLRAGSTHRGWDGLAARCSKVARAGILALGQSDAPGTNQELERLYDELVLAALVRQTGKALGHDEAAIKAHIRRSR